jgi:serine/threonine protein kinase
LNLFKSDYIVRLYDVYESSTFYYLVMELCPGGDLYKMLKRSPLDLPLKFVNKLIKQIAHGLKEIHEKQIIHRDMKT